MIDHDCDDQEGNVFIGRTAGGTDVEVNRRVIEGDRLILSDSIGFHYFAGLVGGRKSILPGVASSKPCMASHLSVLNSGEGTGNNQLAITGNMEGNPVHQAMLEACAMVIPDMLLNTVDTPRQKGSCGFHW